ncbi:MAG TPA: winged helix-turn-helix domain-containing protein [Methanomicrobia archaeon]|nr:winged helix-turn-helix domain-containing protein [Methanomicrobia archaeon]
MHNLLRLVTCSNLRKDLLLSLRVGPKPLSEFRNEINVSSTTAIHALRDLERGNLIFQDDARNYALTKIGEIMALKLEDLLCAVEVLQKHERFWQEHDLTDIPPPLLDKIGDLRKSMPLLGTTTDLFKLHATFIQVLETAHEVKGIYPIFDLEYLTTIRDLVKRKGVEVELIVTTEVLESIGGMIETEELFYDFLDEPNLTLFTSERPLKLTLTLTDCVFYLGLFAPDGLYDFNRALISDDARALGWGRSLYEHYRQRAKLMTE